MTAAVRAELDRIEDFLMRNDLDSEDLANILSALRGPDQNRHGDYIKEGTTTVIRTRAFPRLARRGAGIVPWYMAKEGDPLNNEVLKEAQDEHFRSHIEYAIKALNR